MCIGFGGRNGGGYKEYRSSRARCLGKALGACLVFHLTLAFARILSYSFFAALFDLYLVSFGYCVVRRYFRHPDRKPDPSPLLLCESQQILLNYIMMLSFDYGLSILTTIEILTSKPTNPPPVGLPEYDYRTLSMWQWWCGVVVCTSMLVLFTVELVLSWWLYKTLENEYDDLRYPMWLEEAIPPSNSGRNANTSNMSNDGNNTTFAQGATGGVGAPFRYNNSNPGDDEQQNLISNDGNSFGGTGRALGGNGAPRDARRSRLIAEGL
jgi:hypothetical protein